MISDRKLLLVSVVFIVLSVAMLMPVFVSAAHCEPLKISQAAFAAISVVDIHSTAVAVSSGRGREGNPVMGDGTSAQAILLKSGAVALTILATNQLDKRHPRMTRVMLYSLTAVIAGVSYRNYKLSRGA